MNLPIIIRANYLIPLPSWISPEPQYVFIVLCSCFHYASLRISFRVIVFLANNLMAVFCASVPALYFVESVSDFFDLKAILSDFKLMIPLNAQIENLYIFAVLFLSCL